VTLDVVAGALLRPGAVLAARRRKDGRWEFPGGKIEPGESAAEALVRELREELAVDVTVGEVLGHAEQDGLRLVLLTAQIVAGDPIPLTDHDELRWLEAADLTAVDWLPLDRALLSALPPLPR
jgi:8-oxo-dGTP diphosphatase